MKKIFLLLSFIISANVYAQHNLNYFLQAAYMNNPQLKEYSLAIVNSKNERQLISAENILPKISLSANYLFSPYFNNNGKFVTPNPDPNAIGYDASITNGGLYSAMINVDKNIFNGYLTDALESQVSIKEAETNNNITLLKHDLAKQVTDQYLLSYLSSQLRDLENQILSYLNDEQKVAAKLLESGLIKESDDLLLKIEIENQLNALNNSDLQFKSNINKLLSLCGIKDTTITQLDSVSISIKNLSKASLFNKKYELDSLAIKTQQIIFESKYQPQVSVFFNTGLNAVELDGIQRKFGLSAGLNFSLPIYDGNQRSITRQQNELSIRSISFYRDYFFNELKNQRENSFEKIKQLKGAIESYEKQIRSYEKVISISEKELHQGQLSMVDYLTILKNLIELKKNFVTAKSDYQMEINNYNYWNW